VFLTCQALTVPRTTSQPTPHAHMPQAALELTDAQEAVSGLEASCPCRIAFPRLRAAGGPSGSRTGGGSGQGGSGRRTYSSLSVTAFSSSCGLCLVIHSVSLSWACFWQFGQCQADSFLGRNNLAIVPKSHCPPPLPLLARDVDIALAEERVWSGKDQR
jgi:hypothetical protein